MIKSIATVAVYVGDQETSLEFWTQKVGFEIYRNDPMGPEARWIEVGPANAQTHIVLFPKSMMPSWAEQKASLVFECDDANATFQRLKAKGVNFSEEPQTMPWGTFSKFEDIDGYEYVLKS